MNPSSSDTWFELGQGIASVSPSLKSRLQPDPEVTLVLTCPGSGDGHTKMLDAHRDTISQNTEAPQVLLVIGLLPRLPLFVPSLHQTSTQDVAPGVSSFHSALRKPVCELKSH